MYTNDPFLTPLPPRNLQSLLGTVEPTPFDERAKGLGQFKKGVTKRLPDRIKQGVEKADNFIKRQLMVSREDGMNRSVLKSILVTVFMFVLGSVVFFMFQFLHCEGLEKLQKESESFSFPSSLFKKATWWMLFFLFLIYFTMTFSELVLENVFIFGFRRWLGKKRKWFPRDLLNLQQFAILIYIGYQMWISVYPSCMNGIVADIIQQNIWILAAPSILKLCKGLWKLIESHPKDSSSFRKYTQKIIQFIIDLFLPILMFNFIIRPFQSSCSTENEVTRNLYTTYYTTITFVVYIFLSFLIENFFLIIVRCNIQHIDIVLNN